MTVAALIIALLALVVALLCARSTGYIVVALRQTIAAINGVVEQTTTGFAALKVGSKEGTE